MNELKLITYGFVGFSFSQILGILTSGFSIYQATILYLILGLLMLIPGFIRWGILQRTNNSKLQNHHILSCFVPSLVGIGVITIGFLIGFYVGG